MAAIDDQLVLLLEIQDLSTKCRELETGEGMGELEQSQFGMDLSEAKDTLKAKVTELEGQLADRIRRRYERIAGRVDRVVVPVLNGTCYGCFVQVATATAGEESPNAELQTCEHCGRFLYFPNA